MLTSQGGSLKLKGNILRVGDESVIVYSSETWQIKAEDAQR